MKQKTTQTRSRWLFACLLSLLMTLSGSSPAWADELTINNGSATSSKVPIEGLNADSQKRSEFIIPANMLDNLTGGTITKISFNLSSPPDAAWTATFKVFVKEVVQSQYTNTGSYYSPSASFVGDTETTTVYTGTLDATSGTMDVSFNSGYVYGGGNLLVGFYITEAGNWKSATFTGATSDSYSSCTGSMSTASGTPEKFLPKITFTYTPDPNHVSKPSGAEATNVAATTATVSWAEADGVTWEYTYKTADEEPEEAGSYTSTDTRTVNLTNLSDNTTYYFFVRAIKNTSHSTWTKVTFKTLQNAVDLTTGSFADNFESGNNWAFVNGNLTNAWAIGSATSNGGTKSMYISNNGGTSNAYTMTSETMVYATKLFTLAAGKYDISYDWKAYGEGNYDYMRVAIVPAATVLNAGTSVPSGFSTTGLPDGWIAIDGGGKLNVSSTFANKAVEATIPEAGNYMVVFGWRNDTSTGNNPPAAIDNFSIAFQACPKPTNVEYTGLAANEVTLNWNTVEETTWEVYISTESAKPAANQEPTASPTENTYQFTGLTTETHYYAWVRAVKAAGKSDWVGVDFTTPAAVPVIALSTTSHNFGMVSDADAQALTLTISNTGGAALTGLTVTPTSGFAVTDMEGNALTTTTIAASSTLSVKVKLNDLGQQNGTITIDGNEIDAQVVNVSGYMLDDTKICETFANASSVSRWTVASGWTFNASTGAYSGTSERTMTTPKISVGEGNVLALNVKLGWSGGSFTIEGSTDNGTTWNAFEAKTYNSSNGGLNTSSYVLLTINDIPITVNKIRLTGYYAYINVFNGFTYVNDPQVGFFSNEACTSAQASPATKNFGFASEAQSQAYYFKNTGNGQVDLTIDAPSGFTATVNDGGEALTENEVATLTITMPATEGLHDGTITVTAKNHDDDSVLGTFLVNANGGITGTKNNVVLTAFPAGWKNNNWAINSGAARIWSSTPSDLITTTLRVTAGDKLLIDAKKYDDTDDSQLSYSYSANNGTSWSDPVSLTSSLGTDYKIVAISGIPESDVLMKFTGTYAYIRQIYGFEAVAEPIMEFAADGTTKNFGMVSSNTTSDAYTITNSGTALLDNLLVTCDNDNFEIAVADNATSIAAGGNVTFTVALKTTAWGSQSGTVTISGTGVESKTLNVKGYVADNTKIFTTFTAQPDRWTNSSWTFDANGATAGYSNIATLTSPKIVASTQTLAISAKLQGNSNSYYVKVEGYDTANSDWTYSTTLSNDVLNSTSFTVVELNDIPTTVNRIRLVGKYVIVNALNGFTYDENDPEFSLFSDSECNTPIAGTTATNNWGFVNEDKTATYYIKNTGTGTLTLSKTDAPAGMTATLGATFLAASEITSLVISMENDTENNEGYHGGDVVLTGKNNASETLGTFTVTSSGVVVGSKTDINFTTLDAFPAGWETTTWSVTANTKATVGYSQGTLTTGTYTVAAGEKLVVKTKKNSYSGTLSYKVSTDGGANFGASTTITPSSTSEYELKVIDGIAAGSNVKIEFTGYYVDIERIYGYTAKLEPVMTLSPAAANYDFGMQTEAANYVITVTNTGTANMTNLAAALTGDDAADYQVAVSKTTVPYTGENTATVTVTLKASTEYKTHNATLTISANGLADKVITLKGKTRDASKNYVDFASEIPSSFVEKGAWTVSSGAAYSGSGESSLITQPINLATGEKLYFDAKKPSYGSPSLQVRYSVNGGISWSDYVDYTAAISSTAAYSSHEIDLENASAVTAIVEFKGNYYVYLDNIYGGVLNDEAPMIRITKSAAVVENGTTEAFGSISTQATATYTITNVGNGTLAITSPVAKTGVATATVSATSLSNGQSATLTITMPVEAPYEYKEGVVTVETSLGDFVINYNATVLNPNALDEQFASGKPAGWYFGGQWTVASNQARNDDGTISDLITEQLHVAGTSDALTFQAKRYSSHTAPTWSVAYSTDRVNWTDVDVSGYPLSYSNYTTITIDGLDEGDYYLRIRANRLYLDNFLGWEKKNNTRDLYVTATSFPATTTKGNEATITATVTSLIADEETGVYAKLFINGVQEGDASAAEDIALNGTKTFSFTYAIPENKTAQIKVYYSDNSEAFATAENAMKVNYTLEQTSTDDITTGTFNVTLDRTFVEGWNTICLPFAVSAENMKANYGENVALYELTSFTDGNLKFTKLGEEIGIAAGKPYLIYVENAITESKSFVDAVISETTPTDVEMVGVTFHGTFAPIAADGVLTGKYGISSDGRIAKANSATYMNGFRGYLEGNLTGARISVYDETTGITRVYGADEIFGKDDKVYDLNGRRVENAKKGLYIVNGRKVVVK